MIFLVFRNEIQIFNIKNYYIRSYSYYYIIWQIYYMYSYVSVIAAFTQAVYYVEI